MALRSYLGHPGSVPEVPKGHLLASLLQGVLGDLCVSPRGPCTHEEEGKAPPAVNWVGGHPGLWIGQGGLLFLGVSVGREVERSGQGRKEGLRGLRSQGLGAVRAEAELMQCPHRGGAPVTFPSGEVLQTAPSGA